MSFAIVASVAVAGITAAITSSQANKQKKRAQSREQQARDKIAEIENNRQKITDPYKEVKDLSGMIQNPYANLQVATQAAEMQAEQADLGLATTLESLRTSGASAGGATALAQAALQSKQGVSASIETQEAENSRLRAQGQTQMQQMLMAEKGRVQQARVQGRQFVFGAKEDRDIMQLNRQQSLMQQNQQIAASAQEAKMGAISSAGGSIAGAFASDRRLKKNIKLIGYSPSGLKIYAFEYIDKIFGKGIFQGVMSDEIPQYAVTSVNGYDMVNYSELDVEFKQINK